MNAKPAEDLLSLQASRNAVRQYRRAARLHSEMADSLKVAGWGEWAKECKDYAEMVAAAALAEKLTHA